MPGKVTHYVCYLNVFTFKLGNVNIIDVMQMANQVLLYYGRVWVYQTSTYVESMS